MPPVVLGGLVLRECLDSLRRLPKQDNLEKCSVPLNLIRQKWRDSTKRNRLWRHGIHQVVFAVIVFWMLSLEITLQDGALSAKRQSLDEMSYGRPFRSPRRVVAFKDGELVNASAVGPIFFASSVKDFAAYDVYFSTIVVNGWCAAKNASECVSPASAIQRSSTVYRRCRSATFPENDVRDSCSTCFSKIGKTPDSCVSGVSAELPYFALAGETGSSNCAASWWSWSTRKRAYKCAYSSEGWWAAAIPLLPLVNRTAAAAAVLNDFVGTNMSAVGRNGALGVNRELRVMRTSQSSVQWGSSLVSSEAMVLEVALSGKLRLSIEPSTVPFWGRDSYQRSLPQYSVLKFLIVFIMLISVFVWIRRLCVYHRYAGSGSGVFDRPFHTVLEVVQLALCVLYIWRNPGFASLTRSSYVEKLVQGEACSVPNGEQSAVAHIALTGAIAFIAIVRTLDFVVSFITLSPITDDCTRTAVRAMLSVVKDMFKGFLSTLVLLFAFYFMNVVARKMAHGNHDKFSAHWGSVFAGNFFAVAGYFNAYSREENSFARQGVEAFSARFVFFCAVILFFVAKFVMLGVAFAAVNKVCFSSAATKILRELDLFDSSGDLEFDPKALHSVRRKSRVQKTLRSRLRRLCALKCDFCSRAWWHGQYLGLKKLAANPHDNAFVVLVRLNAWARNKTNKGKSFISYEELSSLNTLKGESAVEGRERLVKMMALVGLQHTYSNEAAAWFEHEVAYARYHRAMFTGRPDVAVTIPANDIALVMGRTKKEQLVESTRRFFCQGRAWEDATRAAIADDLSGLVQGLLDEHKLVVGSDFFSTQWAKNQC